MKSEKRFDEIADHRFSYALTHALVRTLGKSALGLKAYGEENIPVSGAALIATNHRHWLDIFIEPASVRQRHVSMVAKKEVYETPLLGRYFGMWDSIPVDRENPTSATTRLVIERLKAGRLVSVKPEGTRTKKDRLGELNRGVAVWARRAEVPTIPAAIRGVDSLGRAVLHRSAEVHFGEPIAPPQSKIDEPDFLAELQNRIESLYYS